MNVYRGKRLVVVDGQVQCALCGKFKPATCENFTPCKSNRLGITSRCRPCSRAYVVAWRRPRRAEINRRQRERYAVSDKTNARWRKRREEQPFQARAEILRDGILSRVRRWNLPCDEQLLTVKYLKAWLLRQRTCECCGAALRISMPGENGGRASPISPSIDRLVPARGYVAGNVFLLCWRCNNLKRDASSAELRRVADWMDRVGRCSGLEMDLPITERVNG